MRRAHVAGALLAAALVAGVSAAGATVFQSFYLNAAGTVRAPDVTLAAGSDSSASCSAYPCATVTVSGTSDTATVSFSLFKADPTFNPPPATYYTDLVEVKDAGNSHLILGISVYNVTSSSANDFGEVAVYYCTVQCAFGPSGSVSGGTAAGSLTITSAKGGNITGTFPQTIAPGGTQYIEVVAYAGSGAALGDKVTFKVAVQWA